MEFSITKKGRFQLSCLSLAIPQLPSEFVGYRVVQLTDLHFGPATRRLIVEEALSLASSLRPDLLVITGDFVVAGRTGFWHKLATDVHPRFFRLKEYRRRVRALSKELGEILTSINIPDGILAVRGNHEILEGSGTIQRYLAPKIFFLKNSYREIQREGSSLLVTGVDDKKYGSPSLSTAFPKQQKHIANILLSHNPDIVLETDNHLLETANLILCGHTHGGQIRLPFVGALLTCTEQRQHIRGLSYFGKTPLYVNSGVGHVGLPLRAHCPPEVLSIELVPA